jgi:circadian clock protein KaiB
MRDSAGSRAREGPEDHRCRLRLFVVGGEPNSLIAQANLSMLSRESLPAGCVVEVLDVATNFEEALKERVLVTPTLIVKTDTSDVRILGTLADKAVVLAALGIRAGATA